MDVNKKKRNRLFAFRQITPITHTGNCKVRKVEVKTGKPPPKDKIWNEIYGAFKSLGRGL